VLVLGSGIAGASLAFELARRGIGVTVLEAERTHSVHSTGRSAALFAETYGPVGVRALTRASRDFFLTCPGTAFPRQDTPLLTKRSILWALSAETRDLDHGLADIEGAQEVSKADALALCPALRDDYVCGGFVESGAMDMDVAGIQGGFVAEARRHGAEFVYDAPMKSATRTSEGTWRVETEAGEAYEGKIVANAAGAWAEVVARRAGLSSPVTIAPKRRTIFTFNDAQFDDDSCLDWPFLLDARVAVHSTEGAFYFKPQGRGTFIASPGDGTPTEPCDVYPDDLDIAICIDSIMKATRFNIRSVASSWAGLRSFANDGDIVLGEAPEAPGFFYVAGQGGYGIQTAPAAAAFAADLIEHGDISDELKSFGLTAAQLSPARFAT